MNNKLSLLVNFIGVDKMSGALRNIIGLGGKGSKSLRALAGDAKKLTREIADYERQIRRTSGNATDLIDRQRQAMEQLEQVQRRIARQQRLAAIEADRQAMRRRGAELRSQGTENVAGGVAMSAPLIYAAKAAAEFSSGMVDIQQKAELSNAATDRMANTIVRLADAARQMPEDMRGAVDVLSGFGLDPRKAVAMVGPIGRLATAFKVDLSDGASAAYANLNNLKVPIGKTAAALDVMAAAGNAGAFEVKDMAKWFPGLTAQMQALGQRGVPAVADLSAALQIARRGAGDADAAANNVQNLLSKINAPATARAFAKSFGVDLPAALKKAYAQGKTPLEAIAELTRQATKGDLTKIGYVFEDMQAQAALRSLIQDLDDFRKMRADIGKASGTTDRAFAQRAARDATVNWRAFLGTASRLAIVLGTTLLPVVTDVLGGLGSAATMIANWAQANPALAGTLMQGASALIAVKIGMGAAQFAIGTILGPIGNLIAIARKAAPVLGLLRTAFLFLGRGMLQAGIMMMANPIVMAIVAVGAAIGVAAYLIYTHWDGIKATFRAGWAFLTAGWTAFRHWISGVGGNLMDGIINGLKAGWSALKSVWNTIVSYLPASMRKKWEIHSPSRLFMRMGGNVADGLALGVDRGAPRAQASMSRLAGGVMAAGALSLTPFASAARPAAGPAATAQRGGDTYHFHITQQPGEDAEAFARRLQALIDKANDRKRRRGFEDA